MKITLKPSDIIERCIWTEYKMFCLKKLNEEQINNIIKEDNEIEISEEDAFVIGLIKVIQTDNLVHRFKLYMIEFLKNRSSIKENKVIISKSAFIKECNTFDQRFPSTYNSRKVFADAIEELNIFIVSLIKSINELKEIKMEVKRAGVTKIFTYIQSKHVEKLIKI